MKLRHRIALAALLGCGILAATGIGIGEHRARRLEEDAQATDQRLVQQAWQAAMTREAGRLQATVLERLPLDAPAPDQPVDIPSRLGAIEGDVRARGVSLLQLIPMETAAPAPRTAATAVGPSGVPLLDPALVREVVALQRPLTGVLRKGDEVLVAATVPVSPSGALSGAVLLIAGPIANVLAAMRNETGLLLGLTDGDGMFLVEPLAPPGWTRIVARIPPEPGPARLVGMGDRILSVTDLPLTDIAGQRIGFRRVLADGTARQMSEDIDRLASAGAILALFGAVAVALLWWLRSAFRGLESALEALEALARGDTTVQIEGAGRRDEVGAAARALRVFRQGQIELQSSTSRSERRRMRQLRYIEAQLDRLSATLGAGAGAAMQGEIRRATSTHDGAGVAREDALDTLSVALRMMVDRVSTQHLDLQRMLAEQSSALETRQRMEALEREMSVVAEMQARLAPTSLPGTGRVAVRSRLIQGVQLGGDFLDFFWLDPAQSRLALVLGSVDEGGVSSAFLTISARALVRALASDAASPGACLARVSDLLVGENEAQLALKMMLVVVDLPNNLMVIARAGLPCPISAIRPGEAHALDIEGAPPLALRPGTRVLDTTVPLQDRMTVLLFSPGLLAARRGGVPLGVDGVRETMAQAPDLDVERLLDWMADQAAAPETQPEGDVSMVAIRVHEGGAMPASSP